MQFKSKPSWEDLISHITARSLYFLTDSETIPVDYSEPDIHLL